ncbi:cytosolic protein [Microcoleus sp. FACHB-672]|uniref:cytosolic protein n=1 Tax=Microcoleus sp. FACHB-672 TaxID=2692825 RepID=UPI001687270E|nr:cytosolic protein [Microcoleus sp. FACHB-672]MBD2044022.1 cytosolic protein [Microcoleus sp. FACHB-672]
MSEPQTEYDTPWKDALERYFEEFIAFFFPQAHGDIDWQRGYEFLDKELQQVVRDAELGRRLVDKLVKIYRAGGEETWVLVHIEVQNQEESNFAERMYVYHYRIFDRYKRSIASLAVLGDERAGWRPERFSDELWGCEVNFRFPVVKLLDYQESWQALERSRNPFATVVMAHLKAQETRDDARGRFSSKLYLTRRLYEQGYEREDVINLFGFIDWVMNLPAQLEQDFWREVSQLQEERRMPYITSVERIGIEKGIEQSRQQMREILLESIALGLDLKFGSEGLIILPEISEIQEVEQLRAILNGLKTVNALSELRQIYSKFEVYEVQ